MCSAMEMSTSLDRGVLISRNHLFIALLDFCVESTESMKHPLKQSKNVKFQCNLTSHAEYQIRHPPRFCTVGFDVMFAGSPVIYYRTGDIF